MKGKKILTSTLWGKEYYPLRKGPHFVKWTQETAGIFKTQQPFWRAMNTNTYNKICHSRTNIDELSTEKSSS